MKVLFVCYGNSCRSQMAEGLAKHLAADVIDAQSAGVSPLGEIARSTREVLLERGIHIDDQYSKFLTDKSLSEPDLIVNISGLLGHALFAGRAFEDWDVEDPYGDDMETYRRICDDIEARVRDLAERLRTERAAPGARM
jgi:protein-tyrosine-phosphatase